MRFEYKPDFEDARLRWQAFWQGEIIDRPLVRVTAPKDGAVQYPGPPGLQDPKGDLVGYAHAYDKWASGMYFGGEAIPFFFPNFGPDIYSAFLGAEIEGWEHGTGTTWAVPFINDWKTDSTHMDKPHGFYWDTMLKYTAELWKVAEGKWGVGVLDLHSNLDCLSAVRGAQNLCFDLVDCPEDVELALERVLSAYEPIYEGLRVTSGQDKAGSSSWLPAYCEDRYGVIQCDFVCMVRPEHAKRFLYPSLIAEAESFDHCLYHLDGPDALCHLDDLCAIDAIDGIQWVPGSGNAPVIEWMDLLKKMQAAGKSLYINATIDEIKSVYHKELKPELVLYDVWASSQTEADGLLDWLKANT